jgi:hypothetical protein
MTFLLFLGVLTQLCQSPSKTVGKDFSYPPSMLTETAKSMLAESLSGKIVYGENQAVPAALVEIINADKTRTRAVLADAEGWFCLAGAADGRYLLRISKPQFDTQIVPFTVSHKAKQKSVLIQLHVSG